MANEWRSVWGEARFLMPASLAALTIALCLAAYQALLPVLLGPFECHPVQKLDCSIVNIERRGADIARTQVKQELTNFFRSQRGLGHSGAVAVVCSSSRGCAPLSRSCHCKRAIEARSKRCCQRERTQGFRDCNFVGLRIASSSEYHHSRSTLRRSSPRNWRRSSDSIVVGPHNRIQVPIHMHDAPIGR